MAPALDLWFDFASTYSYVAAMRAETLCRDAGVSFRWKPFLLGPIFTQQLGIKDSPFNVQHVRGRYMWRDLERLCAKFELRWQRPSVFPRNSLLAARLALTAKLEPWIGPFVRSVFEAGFAEDRDIADSEVLGEILRRGGAVPERWLEQAQSADVKSALRAQTVEAASLGIFGAPSLVVGTELFFGQDRLVDAIAWASAQAEATV